MIPELSLAVSVVFAVVGVILTVRNWVYGGSVIKVELDLVQWRWMGADITGSVARWAAGDIPASERPDPLRLDVIKITVRNLGRTAATAMDPGLQIVEPRGQYGAQTHLATRLLEPGATELPLRVEAHDAKEFYFLLAPIIRGVRADLANVPIKARASITTGTGKAKLSPRWRRSRETWLSTWNILTLPAGVDWIGKEPATLRSRLWLWAEETSVIFAVDLSIRPQFVLEAARRAADGENHATINSGLLHLRSVLRTGAASSVDDQWLSMLSEEAVKLRR